MRDPSKKFFKEAAEKVESERAKMALERERKEKKEEELFELLDNRYAKKEESDGWWKKKLGLSAVIVTLFLGLLAGWENLRLES